MKTITAATVRKIASDEDVDLAALLDSTVDGRALDRLSEKELRKVARVARMSTLVREHVDTAKKSSSPKRKPKRTVEQTENMESSTPDAGGDVSGAGKTAAWVLGAREAICSYSN